MARTAFDPQLHGFAFVNTWEPDEADEQQLSAASIGHLKKGHLVKAIAFGIARALLHRDIRALSNAPEHHSAQGYGLCGGMCFTVLDFYETNLSIPREIANDRPSPGTKPRRYIWWRQIDSLISDGARFVTWPFLLNYMPTTWPFPGGRSWLLARSQKAWNTLKAPLDMGKPVPLGLVRDTKNLFDNHQVLAVGYEEKDEMEGTIYVYDPNCPGQVSTISLKFGGRSLDGQESGNPSAKLMGFFCQGYTPADPREAIE
jgi:hypothetical protein